MRGLGIQVSGGGRRAEVKLTTSLFLLLCNESFASRDVFGDEWLLGTWDSLFDLSPFVIWDLRGPFYVLDSALHGGVLEVTQGIGIRYQAF
jgi:hypothetical protein